MLGMAVLFANTLRELLTEFVNRPVDVVIKLEREAAIAFPAVTLCNINPVSNSKLSDLSLLSETLTEHAVSRKKRGANDKGNGDLIESGFA